MDDSIEEWKTVVGYEGLYEVSSLGRIKSIRNGKCWPMRQSLNSRGYYRIKLSNNGLVLHTRVHRIVAIAFLGPIPEGHEVNHKNLLKTDNRACNLEYVTNADNIRHFQRSGLQVRGEAQGLAKLNEDAIRDIRRSRRAGVMLKKLAAKYGVTETTISDIANWRTWLHVI